MKQINVIDFDKTLIPFDSFRIYVIKGIKKLNLKVIFYTILRICRFISNEKFKKRILCINVLDSKELELFISFLIKNIDQGVLAKIKKHTINNTVNILCSA